MSSALSKPSTVVIDLDEDEGRKPHDIVDVDAPVPLNGKRDPDVVDEDTNPLDRLPDDAVRNADGSVTLPLHEKVTLRTKKNGEIRERVFTELVFHRLNGANLRKIGATSDENQVPVTFACSTRLNDAVMNALFDKMDQFDIARAGRVLNFFGTNGPKTGG
ncbi:hypothetical protein B5K08_15815 [Rhizobium leguminosarum bv. trifolii]|uniref:Uncharacterized protein n=1 Tax=Rhizobium leguminosarum bv. trifolii TaxID=386 RepID=A0A3E1BIW0_RHILT|nr:hypothetical protein [Rhizobium leguminosarum]RFB91764.1 hypothetical protein B5K08_15815 [Rhizobium leguminosarum bv. trifolii]RFB92281.1 hypothetical protein B5K10_15810 [Rhizobium leguminosarum bv. trifolii]